MRNGMKRGVDLKKTALTIGFLPVSTLMFAQEAMWQEERIGGFRMDGESLTFIFWNTGFTDRASFIFDIENRAESTRSR